VSITATTQFLAGGNILLSPSPGGSPTTIIGDTSRIRIIGTYDAATNSITANQVISGLNPVRTDNTTIVLDGLVQSVTGPGRFRLNDTDVDASATVAGAIVQGNHVQVRGRKSSGILTASEFRLIRDSDRIEYVVQGDITDYASASAFKLRGESINAISASFTGGSATDLANGKKIRIRGFAGPGQIAATSVTFLP
jgi:hypothetical protein